MRVFVALPIFALQDEVLKIQKKYSNLPVRWILPHNLHITLVPPWEENNIELISNNLKLLDGQFQAFKINFNLISYGPNKFSPRLIWASGSAPLELLKLRNFIFNVLGKKPEKRPFLLHLTLARFDSGRKIKLPPLDVKIFWEEKVKEFVLMRSHLLKAGAEYETLEKFKLNDQVLD